MVHNVSCNSEQRSYTHGCCKKSTSAPQALFSGDEVSSLLFQRNIALNLSRMLIKINKALKQVFLSRAAWSDQAGPQTSVDELG
jgi:hypothetical protein